VGIRVNASAAGEEEAGTRRLGHGGLDAGDWLGDGAELERADAGGGEQRREHHVVARGDADDVVAVRVEVLHEPRPRPPGPQNHDPRLLPLRRRAQTGQPLPGLIPRSDRLRRGGGEGRPVLVQLVVAERGRARAAAARERAEQGGGGHCLRARCELW
jgi:hypothetical protein